MTGDTNEGNIANIWPLTPMQQCMLFSEAYEKKKGAYIQQLSFNIEGDFSVDAIKKAFLTLVDNVDIFRSRFIYQKLNEAKSIILKKVEADFRYYDCSQNKGITNDEFFCQMKKDDINEGFDLQKSQLCRIKLVCWENKKYSMIITFHHIIIDGWSMPIVISRLFDYYKIIVNNGVIPNSDNRFGDYVKYLGGVNNKLAITYWKKYLEGYSNEIVFPSEKRGYNNSNYILKKEKISFSSLQTHKMKKIASDCESTLSTFVNVIWAVILSVYSNCKDVAFGRVVSGRNVDIPNIENKIGLMINTVPLRVKIPLGMNFMSLLRQVQSDIIYQNKYEYMSLVEIQAGTELKNKLISHIIAFENYPLDNLDIAMNGMDFSISDISGNEHTSYDINLIASSDDCLNIEVSYNSERHEEKMIKQICSHIYNTIEKVIENPDQKIDDICIFNNDEFYRLKTFNNNTEEYKNVQFVFQYLEKNAALYPDKTALYYNNSKMSYSELNKKANSLANFLRENDVGANDIIAVEMKRSFNMMIAVFGIMKSGAAYMPLLYSFPESRKKYLIEQGRAKFIITDDFFEDYNVFSYNSENPVLINKKDDIAYVIYTSGSTGVPKGALNTHEALLNRIEWMNEEYKLSNNDILIQKTICTFDVSLWELFWWSFSGAGLVIPESGSERDPNAIADYLRSNNVTIVHFVPSMFRIFLQYIDENEIALPDLRLIITSGEELLYSDAKKIFELSEKMPDVKLANLYGPAECAVDVTYYNVDLNNIPDPIPIGKSISNTKIYVLGEDLKVLPIGVIGEIYIGGTAVGNGYLNNPDETRKVFINDPFNSDKKLYKTGDLGRYLPDGNVEYFGRNDFQVKIRGVRIEIKEIESQVMKVPGITNSCVIAVEERNGEKSLVCFAERKSTIVDANNIRNYLMKKLPIYMLPSKYVFLDNIPLNSSHKTDRKALKQMNLNNLINVCSFSDNEWTDLQKKIRKIWSQVLDIPEEKLSIDSNFFHVGGHSIKAFSLATQIEKQLNIHCEIKIIFDYPTIRQISEYYEKNKEVETRKIPIISDKKYYNLSPVQKGIYLTTISQGYDKSYNMPTLYKLHGNIDICRLSEVVDQLIKCHDILRTIFVVVDGEIKSTINYNMQVKIETAEVNEQSEASLMNTFVQSFDLEHGPLFRIKLLNMTNGEKYLFFDMHHIISDGYSMGIFVKDLFQLYKGGKVTRKELQYKDYAEYLFNQKQQLSEYWKSELDRYLNLKISPVGENKGDRHEGKSVYDYYDKNTLNNIKKIADGYSITLFAFLMSVYSITLSKFLSNKDVIIGTGSAARQNADISDIIGPFVASSFLIVNVQFEMSMQEFSKTQADNILKMISHNECSINDMLNYVSQKNGRHYDELFDNLFILQSVEIPQLMLENTTLELCDTGYANYILKFAVYAKESIDELKLDITYDAFYVNDDRVEEFMRDFRNCIEQLIKNPESTVGELMSSNIQEIESLEFDFDF